MKLFYRLQLALLFLAHCNLGVFAQNGIITTCLGPGVQVKGDPATAQNIDRPSGVAPDGSGGFYVASWSQNRVYRVAADTRVTLIAGTGTSGFGGDGGPATAAQLNRPRRVAADGAGNVYIVDHGNHRIRKVTAAGVISTVAGNGKQGFAGDGGPATAAELNFPRDVAVDAAGNLYIADSNNQRIRKVTAAGIISTVAGNGTRGFSGDGAPATAAQLGDPDAVAIDDAGNLYSAETYNHRVRKITSSGVISTVAGNGSAGFSGDGGPATAAQLSVPSGVAVGPGGDLYIVDFGNQRIRRVTRAGIIETMAGDGNQGFKGDGGPAAAAQLDYPRCVAVDSAGLLYIVDSGNRRIRKITQAKLQPH